MAHLYFKMKETTAAQQPPDVRILKYLLVKKSAPLSPFFSPRWMVLWGVHPPAYAHRSLVRTEGNTFAAKTCALSLVQGPFSVAPVCQTQFTAQFIRTKFITGRERERERERIVAACCARAVISSSR
jgi:hypothetical protein